MNAYLIARTQLDRLGDALDTWRSYALEPEEKDALADGYAVVTEVKLSAGHDGAAPACPAGEQAEGQHG